MAVRIRKNGSMWCARMNPEKKGDLYIDDSLHYFLSVEKKVLVTEEMKLHKKHKGQWYFINDVPKGVKIDKFYKITK